MSSDSHLPIYNSTFLLLKDLHTRVQKFSQSYKYMLGEKMLGCAMDMIKLIAMVNRQKSINDRVETLGELELKIEELFVMVRIAEELKQFNSAKAYPHLTETITDISRQCTGWKNSYMK